MSDQKLRQPPVAIVGIGGLFPGSVDVAAFWNHVLAGTDLITDVPSTHWSAEHYFDEDQSAPDKTYCTRGGFLPEVDFDALGFGVPPNLLSSTDTSQLLGLMVARATLEDAYDGKLEDADRSRVSVLLGVTSGQELFGQMAARLAHPQWRAGMKAAGIDDALVDKAVDKIRGTFAPWTESTFPGLLGNVVAGRICNRLDLGGANAVMDAACASSLAAVRMALDELTLGRADVVLTGGVDTLNDIFMYMCFSKTPALSATGGCRPFDAKADGTLLGEGLGMVALKRLDDAERDGDHIYAVIRGLGASSDGKSKSVYAPVAEGQARALRRAYDAAGYEPATVGLVEAHGTGTRAGDVAEVGGLKQVFGDASSSSVALGSVKSQIGHTKSAAGAAGLLKVALALHHKVLPPTINVDEPNPKLGLEGSPFYVNHRARPWVHAADHPRRASVSALGFGGSNYHVTLEEYLGPRKAKRLHARPAEVICASAPDVAGLQAQLEGLLEDERPFAEIARATQAGFDVSAPRRVAFTASSRETMTTRVNLALGALAQSPDAPRAPAVHFGAGGADGEVAFLFPGQGSQFVDMGASLAMCFDEALRVFDAADEIDLAGERLSDVVFPPPALDEATHAAQADKLRRTEWAQPALVTAGAATARVLGRAGVGPALVGGHSLGELTALWAAGVMDLPTLVQLARTRGERMAEVAELPGAMVAVRAAIEEIEDLVDGDRVVIANHNAPDEVVLSGETAAIAEVERHLEERGNKFRRLHVATAFHSPIVAQASEELADDVVPLDMRTPAIPVYSNETAAPHEADVDEIKVALATHVGSPVRFVEQIDAMYAAGARVFVEVGPGGVLTGLVGRILDGRDHVALSTCPRGEDATQGLMDALAGLAAAGVPVDFGALWTDVSVVAPGVEHAGDPKLAVAVNGSNVGKPALPPPAPVVRPAPTIPVAERSTPMTEPKNPSRPAVADPGWVAAFREAQRQTAEAHAAFQQQMADAHMAFLRAFEASTAQLTAVVDGAPATFTPPALPELPLPQPVAAPVVATPVAPTPVAPVPTPAPAQSLDVAAATLAVVAEKTGYPLEALTPAMRLEADLGIDSIKRVEILSAVQERNPGLPPVDAAKLGELTTLGEVIAALDGGGSPSSTAAVVDVEAAVLAVVAEKTGYPLEALAPTMRLEADLGIDSIKRVEILSAVQERTPGLPTVDAAKLGELSTLGEVIAALDEGGSPSSTAAAAAVDVEAAVLAVVAEKTGYPLEALAPTMRLEADLGIDSIKRVEILSAVQERTPGLPTVDAAKLGELSTLGEVIAALDEGGAPASSDDGSSSERGSEEIVRSVVELAPVSGRQRSRPLERGALVEISPDDRGVAKVLAKELESRGLRARIRTSSGAGAEQPDGLVLLEGLSRPADGEDALVLLRTAFDAARSRAAALAGRDRACLVTVTDLGGDFGARRADPIRALLGGLAGLAKTAAQEWPDASVKHVDVHLPSVEATAVAIAYELLGGAEELEVGISEDAKVTPVVRAEPLEARGGLEVGGDDVIVVTGGARGVTATCVEALLAEAQPKLVILGRTDVEEELATEAARTAPEGELIAALLNEARAAGRELAPAEVRQMAERVKNARAVQSQLERYRALGAEVRYVPVDVRDAVTVEKALDEARHALGPITGVIHGAGVLADKRLEDKTLEQFDAVADTKLRGLLALLRATARDPLKVMMLFSSVAGRYGNVGQSDYALANEAMNKLALAEQTRRGGKCRVRSLMWGPWDGGMVTPALKKVFEERGVAVLPRDQGAAFFVDELRGGSSVEVVFGSSLDGDGDGDGDGDDVPTRVSARDFLFLEDHALRGVPVVPVVVALELIARAARQRFPDKVIRAIRDVEVLRGVLLRRFSNGGDELRVRLVPEGDELLAEIRTADADAPRYRARVELGDALSPAPAVPRVDAEEAFGAEPEAIYKEMLFHGPRFHLIDGVDGVGEGGIVARVHGARDAGWGDDGWSLDAGALDAGLQLVLLYARRAVGGGFLPTSVGSVISYTSALPSGPLRCVVQATTRGPDKVEADVAITGEGGAVLMTMSGVEAHRLREDFMADAPRAVARA
jgi:acyl transferase domain-containing protein/NADP-dependent 3-hydroxy acid dehydrogenase YdfG